MPPFTLMPVREYGGTRVEMANPVRRRTGSMR